MRKNLEPHHVAWLAVHPERSEEWLREHLADGFDVHHLDGDHGNNDPLNLILIECGDHLMLHNGKARVRRLVGPDARYVEIARARNAAIYSEMCAGDDRGVIAERHGLKYRSMVPESARRHAKANSLPWPIRP